MANKPPYTDDGVELKASPGRPPKPKLTEAEVAAIEGLGNQQAAAKISEMRGAHLGSLSMWEASQRRVSHDWLRLQRRKTQPTNNSEVAGYKHGTKNDGVTYVSGPRTIQPVSSGQDAGVYSQVQGEPAKVQEETKGATA